MKRQFEKQLPGLWLNHFVNAYGMTAVAANSMMQNLLSCEPDTCAAPPQLEGVMLVKLVWPGELTTLSAIYEENGLICVKSAFVPGLVEPDE